MFEQAISGRLHTDYSKRGALLDSNLLLVMLTSYLGEGEIEKFKRTRNFSSNDANGIASLLKLFGWVCTSAHIATEVSNLLDWAEGKKKEALLTFLANYIQKVDEHQIMSRDIVQTKGYYKLGVADASLVEIALRERLVLVTADLPLYGFAAQTGVDVINLNHLREIWL